MEDICNKATTGTIFELNYHVILEWKNYKVETAEKSVRFLERMMGDQTFADSVMVASNQAEVKCHRSVLAGKTFDNSNIDF